MIRILGLDLSLTATGVSAFDSTMLRTIAPAKSMTGMPRLEWIRAAVYEECSEADLTVCEDLSFGSNMPGHSEVVMLHGLVRHTLWCEGRPLVLVAPTSLKKFVCGSGSAKKEQMMLDVFKRWNISAADNNQADACGLAQISRCMTGQMEPENQAQSGVVAKVRAGNAAALRLLDEHLSSTGASQGRLL